jgi:ketol-acid reductoisomerase
MRAVLADIRSGEFARDWIAENQKGRPNFKRMLDDRTRHPLETVGLKLRDRMDWLKDDPTPATTGKDKAA